jgi:hypothetical protein
MTPALGHVSIDAIATGIETIRLHGHEILFFENIRLNVGLPELQSDGRNHDLHSVL